MTHWNVINGKFDDDEFKIIKNFMKARKIKNENKLVKRAIEDLIGISKADRRRQYGEPLPREFISVSKFYTEIKKELKQFPRITKKLDDFFTQWRQDYFDEWIPKQNKEIWAAGKKFDKFRKHQPKGRPKNPKKSRGKPKDTGIKN